jgi:hypothetical protein
MVLGLSKDCSNYYFPVTLLKEGNYFNIMKSQNPILLTFVRKIDSEITEYSSSYINNKCDPNKVISELPKHIRSVCKLS